MSDTRPVQPVTPPPARTEASKSPVRKVIAATTGAGLGAATADLVIGGLADLFNGGQALPGYLSAWLTIAVPTVAAALAGYYVKRAPGE